VIDLNKESKERKPEEIRNAILEAAGDIVAKEGFAGLSIRKITTAIGYSPGIVYHYFKNKDEIVASLVNEGYQRILASIATVASNMYAPEIELKEIFTNYIKAALSSPVYYMAVMLSNDPAIRQRTALLQRGVVEHSPTMRHLYGNIKRGIELKRYVVRDVELTAQIIWTASFGLIIKLMLENVNNQQVDQLIESHFDILFNGILTMPTGKE